MIRNRSTFSVEDVGEINHRGYRPLSSGSLHDPAARIELDLARAGVPFFVDKPLSLRPPAEVRQLAAELERLQEEKGLVMSVGYMLRYSPAVVMAKKLLEAVRRRPFFVLFPSVCPFVRSLE